MYRKQIAVSVLALGIGLAGYAQAATQNIKLGFMMDESGSVASADYLAAMDSLADALSANIPLATPAVAYEITVVSFGNVADVIVNKAVINNIGDLAAVNAAIKADTYSNGFATCYECAFDLMRTTVGAVSNTDIGILNMMTDGNPNSGGDGTAGRNELIGAGWDSLSFESVGSGADNTDLAALGFDTGGVGGLTILGTDAVGGITDPLNIAFVLPVSDFGAAYTAAINKKVQQIVTPNPVPVPAALPLMAGGLSLLGLLGGWRRRRPAA